ncbi:MAG: hypothetical protein AAF721_19370 [Myxococcota bacterium]
MRRTLRPLVSFSLGLLMALPFVASSAVASDAVATGDDDDFIGEEAWVKFKLTHAGKTHKHPGYLAVAEEEMILTMGKGGAAHEVSIIVDKGDSGKWSAKVAYKVGDKTIVSASQEIRTKKWITFKSEDGKSKVELHVDPDSKGGEDIEVGKGKGPLDGLK